MNVRDTLCTYNFHSAVELVTRVQTPNEPRMSEICFRNDITRARRVVDNLNPATTHSTIVHCPSTANNIPPVVDHHLHSSTDMVFNNVSAQCHALKEEQAAQKFQGSIEEFAARLKRGDPDAVWRLEGLKAVVENTRMRYVCSAFSSPFQ